MSDLQQKWDQRYRHAMDNPLEGEEPEAASVLREFGYLLPEGGDALDFACGLGGNARLLAHLGFNVQAWDISPVAIEALTNWAAGHQLSLQANVCDVSVKPLEAESFDVIVVSYFLEKTLAPMIQAALRPRGLLFYQTFVKDKTKPGGPGNADFLLAENELLNLFPGLSLRVFRDEGSQGDHFQGLRNESYMVAQKPAG